MFLQEHGATIKPLIKQRIFDHCLPILSEQIRIAQTALKANHLRALCGLLEAVDASIMTLHAPLLIPLVLQVLDLEDAGSRSVAVAVLSKLMGSNQPIIEQHVSSLLSRLVVASSYARESSWVSNDSIWRCLERALKLTVKQRTRSEALDCLRTFPASLSEMALLSHARSVDRGLVVALDDPKRAVRKLAVDCRKAWSKLGDHDD